MNAFDAGFYSSGCSTEDLLNLRYFGTSHAISVGAFDVLPTTVDPVIQVLLSYVRRESRRLEKADLNGGIALGMWGDLPKRVHSEFWGPFSELLDLPEVCALGFIGVKRGSESEWRVFEKQVELAGDKNLPVLIRAEGDLTATHTYDAMRRVRDLGFNPQRCAIRVTDPRVVEPVLEEGFVALLSMGSGHLSPDKIAEICVEFACHKDSIVLSSGVRAESGDVLAIPKSLIRLREQNMDVETISMIAYENAENFFDLPSLNV